MSNITNYHQAGASGESPKIASRPFFILKVLKTLIGLSSPHQMVHMAHAGEGPMLIKRPQLGKRCSEALRQSCYFTDSFI